MTNKEKQYYIYIRSTKERIPVTKEEFYNYYHDINTFRKAQQRHGKCVCPETKRLDCDMDCATCPFSRAGDSVSFDITVINDDHEIVAWVEEFEDPAPLIEDVVIDSIHLTNLLERLNELMPQAIDIGLMRQDGMSDTAISTEIGIPRKTFTDRIKKVKTILKSEFPEFF